MVLGNGRVTPRSPVKKDGSLDLSYMEQKFDPGTAMVATSTVEIAISCRNLVDKDILSKSDPMCVVFHRPRGSNHWVELMRTEVIRDNLNPDFAQKVTMEYRFEEQQSLRFEVYDVDKPQTKLADQDFLGFSECTVAQIIAAGSAGMTLPLNQTNYIPVSPPPTADGKPGSGDNENIHGTMILLAEELASLKDEVTLRLGANGIGQSSCCLFRPKTFFVLSKINDARKYVIVQRSNSATGSDPTWNSQCITMRSLCNGDQDRGLKIECFQEKMNGSHKLIGYCHTTLNNMITLGTGGIKLMSPNSGQETSATLLILLCKISPIYTFVDYIQSGTQIHCCFSIDFTSSNGDPTDPTSLHYFSQAANRPNPYEQAIQAVGDIIQDYDTTKLFATYGFGARIPPAGNISHNFFVTLTEAPYCFGIFGVLEAYRNCIRQIQLYGPTNFAPVIQHVASLVAQNQNGDHYFVLLIVTDGVITDMPQTKEAIVNASSLPLSIIIVGVGGADFEAMEELDGDSVRISYGGKTAVRDIVQFVPYRDAISWMSSTVGPGATQQPQNTWSTNAAQATTTHKLAQVKLAQEVLAEIPDQLTSYMKSRAIFPQSISATAVSPAPTRLPM